MWFKITSFIRFLYNSTNQHGVHSPFVFKLITKCFYQKTTSEKYKAINKIRSWLKKNKTIIEVEDFGQGSKIFKSNRRKVSDIAKIAGSNNKKTQLLIRLVSYFNFGSILEIGTSVGIGSAAMSIANPASNILTIEGCPNTRNIALEVFEKHQLTNIQSILGNFNDLVPSIISSTKFDLVFFDGNHNKEATLNYFNWCLSGIHNDSVFIFDDIHWSTEMTSAWNTIKKHPQVKVTIDTYFWGIVFFRKEQVKEHFIIRI